MKKSKKVNFLKKLIVLDHRYEKVYIYKYDENVWEDPTEMTNEDGVYVIHSDCSYMVVDKIKIEIK